MLLPPRAAADAGIRMGNPPGASFRGMHVAAGVGVALWVVGAILLVIVPGGFWSDIPGGALFGLGVIIETVFTVAIVVARARCSASRPRAR